MSALPPVLGHRDHRVRRAVVRVSVTVLAAAVVYPLAVVYDLAGAAVADSVPITDHRSGVTPPRSVPTLKMMPESESISTGATGAVDDGRSNGVVPSDPKSSTPYPAALAGQVPPRAEGDLRVASFASGLTRDEPGQLATEVSSPELQQARQVAETVQRVRPDVLLLSEFDVDTGRGAAESFRTNYLSVGGNGQTGIDYPYIYTADVNAGVDTGADLDDDGFVGGPDDAYGHGDFPGQAGMVLFSRYPLVTEQIRSFQHFRWQDMPSNSMPEGVYSELEASVLRLSSVSHWDVPVQVGESVVHVLASAPADPDVGVAGAERNRDEVQFWDDYISDADYPVDDDGTSGGLATGSEFVLLGTLGSEPDGTSAEGPSGLTALVESDLVQDPQPMSSGALTAGRTGNETATEVVDAPVHGPVRTARSDYALPAATLHSRHTGVYWPATGQPGAVLVGGELGPGLAARATTPRGPSDHRLVWVDITPGSSD